jgi:hypothetical protein
MVLGFTGIPVPTPPTWQGSNVYVERRDSAFTQRQLVDGQQLGERCRPTERL